MSSIGREFMRGTDLSNRSLSDQQQGLPQPPLTCEPDPELPRVSLPSPDALEPLPVDLAALIEHRRSLRAYSDAPLTLPELSYLLWLTQGIKQVTDRPVTLRTVPSAGARHPFETFLLINRVADVSPGLYRYASREHALAQVNTSPEIADQVYTACLSQDHILGSAVTFIWTAVAYRTIWRYGERSYRYIHLDAGHICQNLYLAAEAVDCGVCAIGAFDDQHLNAVLALDAEDWFAVYVATLGKR